MHRTATGNFNDAGFDRGVCNGRGGGFVGGGQLSFIGRRMAENYINGRIHFITTEIWGITNTSPMMRPFQVLNGQFQIFDRDGSPLPKNGMDWKDTDQVGADEKVQNIMRLTDYRDEENPYMYHCHIIDHEDRGMMEQFVIV
ncbi:MAG: multicopper oxidase domain-containing protein [Gammaproteobacteria bacterium]|nr:multicopper oxidase domain-containing protein [Gammaproteobacteria bacterium]